MVMMLSMKMVMIAMDVLLVMMVMLLIVLYAFGNRDVWLSAVTVVVVVVGVVGIEIVVEKRAAVVYVV